MIEIEPSPDNPHDPDSDFFACYYWEVEQGEKDADQHDTVEPLHQLPGGRSPSEA